MIGKTISHYKILAKLGEGGMGVVYKAEDAKLKRTVALKFLPPSIMASEAEKTRFVHEAQAAAALNHPNICTIYEIDEVDGQSFIAMEFVEGETLQKRVVKGEERGVSGGLHDRQNYFSLSLFALFNSLFIFSRAATKLLRSALSITFQIRSKLTPK
jgi:serine/threonine protein kinase